MKKTATNIVRTLQDAGHQACFAGGCVRDALRGVKPKDYDIVTSATPGDVIALYPKANTVGAHFGVVLVKKKGFHFEIATFRADGDYTDGRRPDKVRFTSAEEDARRRDFTINGMFFDPVADEIIDCVDGHADLEAGLIRAIGNPEHRFAEDHLRMCRAVRFATVLGYEIESRTWEAVKKHAPRIREISVERVRDEFDRIWVSPDRARGFDLLVESGLLEQVIPELLDLRGCDQPPQWHPEGDVYTHTRIMLEMLPGDASLELVLSVLFHDIGKPVTRTIDDDGRIRFNGHDKAGAEMSERILRGLRYSNAVIAQVGEAVRKHMYFMNVQQLRPAKLRRFMARPHFAEELELHRVDCASSHRKLGNWQFLKNKQEEFAEEALIPDPLLTGRDLIALGWRPGPRFKAALEAVQTEQLENRLGTTEEAKRWLADNFPRDE